MTAMPSNNQSTVSSVDDLIDYIASGCKPQSQWRIGTEHEKFCVNHKDGRAIAYHGENGIGELLQQLIVRYGWQPITEGDSVIALFKNNAAISLEPAGQLELSGAPLKTLHDTSCELDEHITQVKNVGTDLGIDFLCLGFHPTWSREDCHWMPKQRYAIMRNYMPKRGNLGLDMMLRTTTIQVNLDFSSEDDMVKKFRVGLFLQPIANALFANSGHSDGLVNGYNSYRANIWQDTDNERCGFLPFVFDNNMGFRSYVDYMLKVPMYFVYRNGKYIDVAGKSFNDFLHGKLDEISGQPTIADWADHLSTAFPEVRLKKFLEMRGADGGLPNKIKALPAFWVGLLYDEQALNTALSWIDEVTMEDMLYAHKHTPKHGLSTMLGRYNLAKWGERAVELAINGLKRRNQLNADGFDESIYLSPLQEILSSGQSSSQTNVKLYGNDVAALMRGAIL